MPDFTHLHLHTHYSLLDGAASIDSLLHKAKENGMKSMAITDHGNMYGVVEFVQHAKKQGIKPIIGCEMYVAEGSRFEKRGKIDRSGHHLILLAKNLTGYNNLCKLCSIGFLEGFYYTPRVDKEMLRLYHEGIIASSACLGGEIPDAIRNRSEEKAEEVLQEYLEIFGDDFYLELQRHGLPEQEQVNPVLIRLAEKYKLKIIATNDVHFTNAEDSEAHNILICLNTGKDLGDAQGMHYTGQEFMKTPNQMATLFEDLPEAISNTQLVVDKIEEYEIERPVILPVFPLPEGFTSEDEYLRHLTYEGAKVAYPELTDLIRDRLDFELNVIADMGFAGYFLIVQDFINAARNMKVLVGPGRGSAAGSAVAFCTRITTVDPILYNLLFERFLNPERVSMPDIDIDFDDEGRDKVIKYVVNKYGAEKVAQIVTFGTMAARSSIRDVARVLKLPLHEADRLAKLIPNVPGMDLKKAYTEVKELDDARKKGDPLVKKTLEFAKTLEGSARHTGTHACGVIIGKSDLREYIPLSTAKDTDMPVTQYEGKFVEYVGMLKMDFLGLKTLSIIKDALENIRQRHGNLIDIDKIPLDDEKTFELFQRADTVGIFQFESEGMRQHLKKLKPTSIEDLIAMNALFRPGPMEFIPLYINRKHGKEKVEYPHPLLEEILKPTYGIMVYQEQIMQAAQVMGGFSLGAADNLRRAMGKKKMDIMEKQKAVFIAGAAVKGVDEQRATKVFEVMMEFANYGFNRSHSAAYSILAYSTGYLKAHYMAEYMASVLTHNLNDLKKITFFIDECKRQNLPVLPPDVNESDLKFSVNKKGEIRFGMAAVKGIGEAAVEAIISERNLNGPYKTIFDFAKRVNLRSVNKKSAEALAMAGAFDSYPNMHRAMFFHKVLGEDSTFLEKILRYASALQSKQNSSQADLFGDSGVMDDYEPKFPECSPWTRLEQLRFEKEVTGFFISGHPLEDFKVEMKNFCTITIGELIEDMAKYKGREVHMAGMVTAVSHKIAKNGNPFGSFVLEDYFDSITITLFSEDYLRMKHFLNEGSFLLLRTRIDSRYNSTDSLELKVLAISLLSETLEKFARDMTLILPLNELSDEFIMTMKSLITSSSGKCRLKFQVRHAEENLSVDLPSRKLSVNCTDLVHKLRPWTAIEYKFN